MIWLVLFYVNQIFMLSKRTIIIKKSQTTTKKVTDQR